MNYNPTTTHEMPPTLRADFTRDETILVLGGGVNACTTTLGLLLLGYDVKMIAAELADFADPSHRSQEVVSTYGCASILTRSQNVGGPIGAVIKASYNTYEHLALNAQFGIREQRHYETFEDPDLGGSLPPYTKFLKDVDPLPPSGLGDVNMPRREESGLRVWGWSFNCLFIETSTYMPKLISLTKALGNEVIQHRLTTDDLTSINTKCIVNCTGAGAEKLFYDSANSRQVQGYLLYGKAPRPVLGHFTGRACSFNHKPRTEEYPSDVYFYPNSDGSYILGGSRREVKLDPSVGEFRGDDFGCRSVEIRQRGTSKNISVPAPIVDITRELLASPAIQYELPPLEELEATFGLRYEREGGPRLDTSVEHRYNNMNVIHNYGHGGAGYTLAWGSALYAIRELSKQHKPRHNDEEVKRKLVTSNVEAPMIRAAMMIRQVLMQELCWKD